MKFTQTNNYEIYIINGPFYVSGKLINKVEKNDARARYVDA